MLSTILVATLAAGPQVKLGAPGLSKLGLSADQANFFNNHLVTRLSEREWLKVVSPDDFAAVLGLERQKELLGCTDAQSSCVAELAGALGVDGIVTGQVAKIGKSFQLNVKVIDPNANALFVYSSERLGTEEAMLDELDKIAGMIAKKLEPLLRQRAQAAGPASTEGSQATRPVRWAPLAMAAAGLAVAAASTVAWVKVKQNWDNLQSGANHPGTLLAAQALSNRDQGKTWEIAGGIWTGVGVLALAGGLLWYFLGDAPAPSVAIGFDGHGGWATLRWELR